MTTTLLLFISCTALLLWAWIGYPVAMIVVAGLLPRRVPRALSSNPEISVIIATRDDPAAVSARVADVFESTYPADRLDVVLCIDATVAPERRDDLLRLAGARVRVVDGDAPGGKAATVNAGVRTATGSVLVFTDTQQRFEPAALAALVAALTADPRVTVAGGALYLPGDRPGERRSPVEWYWAMERRLRAAEARIHSAIGVSGSIYAMWARAWVPMRAGLILDDVFVPMQQVLEAHRVAYTLEARAWDARRTTHDAERTRKIRTLTGNFQLVAWLPTLLVPVRNPVWLQFVSHKLLRLASPWLALGAAIALSLLVLRSAAGSRPTRGILVALAVVLLAFVLPPTGRKLRAIARWLISLNSALVRASINGLRGHWDVW